MKHRYNIMLIGCGHIGMQHLEDIYWRENVAVSATVDLDIEKARIAAVKYGQGAALFGTDYKHFLRDWAIDIVIIATNANSHVSILEDCINFGKHVLCEKPVASNWSEGERFFQIAYESPCKVLVAHILRHNSSYKKIYNLIKADKIGNLKLIRMIQNHHTMDWSRYANLLKDCSPIVDCGVHYFDIMQWFTGAEIQEVSGISTWIDDEEKPANLHDNYGHAHVKLSNGCIGYYEAGWSRYLSSNNTKEFIGDKGRITLTLKENRLSNREEGDLISLFDGENYITINNPSTYKNMYGQLETLINMIESDAPDRPYLEEARSAFAAACAFEIAAKTGMPLKNISQTIRV